MNKVVWQDFWQSIKHTKGQFLSIFGLMMIGAFALVGLIVTGPDMRDTGNHYVQTLKTPDLTVISNYGLDKQDTQKIRQAAGNHKVEFGYMTDTVLKNSHESWRLFSKPKKIGHYELRAGRLPRANNEIAIAAHFRKRYHLGQTIAFTEKKTILGTKMLRRHQFKIVGFVRSSQILSNVNLGQSNSGTGELKGYAVVLPSNFDQSLYTTVNLTYHNLRGLDSYGKLYATRLNKHKRALEHTLKAEAPERKQRIVAAANHKLNTQTAKITAAKVKIQTSKQNLITTEKELAIKQAQLTAQASQINNLTPAQQAQLTAAKQELASKAQLLQTKKQQLAHYANQTKSKLASGEHQIKQSQKLLSTLPAPTYHVYNRREIPGGEGNIVYSTVAQVVEDLAKVFPIFLYFVAALVTFTTMNRFIDEERINSGTMKALGYDDYVIINKFILYGFLAGTLGTIAGIYLGHTLMPQIVYHAYYQSLTLPPIEEHFHWQISLIALLLAWISSVLPAYLTARNEFKEKPAALLLPKPPAAGSKILLEKIPVIWQHLNFTHKVTARNIFRYKKRMLMTIFGVCGSATLLFAGFAVKNSIGNMNNRQFNDLIHYNLIVAQKSPISNTEKATLTRQLQANDIKQEMPIYYQTLTKIAGKNSDTQDITMIVPQNKNQLHQYLHLDNRQTKQPISLTNQGVVISERLANLLRVNPGGHITLTDQDNHRRTIKVVAITEMYMGHFAIMTPAVYQNIFDKRFKPNANLVILKNGSRQSTRNTAAQFMKLSGVSGVVQNTAISQELDVVVQSLNMIMLVLIIVAGLLAIVILYNLTNINIAERIRELSTIKVLGFYNNEVTMYIYRETILLTCIGILVGYLTGYLLYQYILYVVPPANVMFNPALSVDSFLWPLGVVGIVTIALGFTVNYKLKNLDMLAALKSVD
ncbi:FtsX-like permease family protein [Lactobacillus sp. ESL0701]|uniref:FtsX-like permease family protein n=1 Tax=Lactobacillus sp. ESL0701 TaxID=2983217 RepID=UPI0023F9E11D|nr:FtsX-like permease family protein [Lactobacillus sp. ESL0701]MDF7672209.1 FtsX-like permease family protein [Lactobacillus sp. ESL0701]